MYDPIYVLINHVKRSFQSRHNLKRFIKAIDYHDIEIEDLKIDNLEKITFENREDLSQIELALLYRETESPTSHYLGFFALVSIPVFVIPIIVLKELYKRKNRFHKIFSIPKFISF